MDPLVYIVIVNWNGWGDTIECLESVFRNTYKNYRVIICDNNSQDRSIEYIKAWAEGRLDVVVPHNHPLHCLSSPPLSKPIGYIELEYADVQENNHLDSSNVSLVLIRTGANRGFAGGNNVGLQYAISCGDYEYVWLLNNDTVVDPAALKSLVTCMLEKSRVGMCGSTLLFYDDPKSICTLGGATYNKWLGRNKYKGFNAAFSPTVNQDQESTGSRIDYVAGASMLVSRSFLEDVGLMYEGYFLYYEELDWAMRAKKLYTLAHAAKSIVYHKVSTSIGKCNLVADYYWIRNRLVFTRRHFPIALPTVFLGLAISLCRRIQNGQWGSVWVTIRNVVNFRSTGM